LLEQRAPGERGRGAIHLGGHHEPAPAHGHDAGELAQRLAQPLAEAAHACEQGGIVEDVEHGERRRRGHGAAAEGGAVVAGREHAGQPLAADEGPDRQAPAERLGDRDGVRHDAGLLIGPERARPPHAGLDLVEDEEGAAGVAGRAGGAQDRVRQHVDAALALDRLEQHRGGALAHGGCDRLRLGRDGDEARHERRERGLLALLRRGRQRAVGAPVEAAVEDHDLPARARLADDLEGRLVGLGAGVREVHATPDRARGQPLGQRLHRPGEEEVGHVHQLAGLGAHRLHDPGMAVAGVADGDAGQEVEVLVAVRVPQPHALAADELDRLARVVVGQRAHCAGRTFVPMPASVNSSSSSECGARPSMMWA
jgi:hypothetical protein